MGRADRGASHCPFVSADTAVADILAPRSTRRHTSFVYLYGLVDGAHDARSVVIDSLAAGPATRDPDALLECLESQTRFSPRLKLTLFVVEMSTALKTEFDRDVYPGCLLRFCLSRPPPLPHLSHRERSKVMATPFTLHIDASPTLVGLLTSSEDSASLVVQYLDVCSELSPLIAHVFVWPEADTIDVVTLDVSKTHGFAEKVEKRLWAWEDSLNPLPLTDHVTKSAQRDEAYLRRLSLESGQLDHVKWEPRLQHGELNGYSPTPLITSDQVSNIEKVDKNDIVMWYQSTLNT